MWEVGNALGDCGEVIDLQQSWLWFDGSQGIEPQHCMLCESEVDADIQSENCRPSRATIATRISNVLRIALNRL